MKKKLLLYYSGVLLTLLFIVSMVILVSGRLFLEEAAAGSLRELSSVLGRGPDGTVRTVDLNGLSVTDTFVMVFDEAGGLIQATPNSPGSLIGEVKTDFLETAADTYWGGDDQSRVLYLKQPTAGGQTLVLGRRVDYSDRGTANLFRYTGVALLVLAPIAGLIVLGVTDVVMRPVREIKTATSRIASGELSARVKIDDDAELAQIIQNFNSLADRLESTIIDTLDKQNQLEAILTSMNSGVIATDHKQKIIIFNPFAKKIFGIFEDVIGKPINTVLKRINLTELLTVKPEFSEISLGPMDQTTIRYKTSHLLGEDHNTSGLVTVLQDVSDLKKLEQMRSQFVANVSHELKTPLTSIKGFSETLRIVGDEATKNKFLDIIDVEAERLRRLIEDILSLSAIENQKSLAVEIVNAAEVVKETCSLLERAAGEKNIDFSLIIKGDPEFVGDIDKFKQMTINLVDNAIKYTEPNGKVKIRLEEQPTNLLLKVMDTGAGIGEEHIPRLFERFYRVDKSRDRAKGGTGLGLAIVKHIVLGFGGTIEVHSELGKGTVFTVLIPLFREESSPRNNRIQAFKFNE